MNDLLFHRRSHPTAEHTLCGLACASPTIVTEPANCPTCIARTQPALILALRTSLTAALADSARNTELGISSGYSEWFGSAYTDEQVREAIGWIDAQAKLLDAARGLAKALLLGQKGFGRMWDPLVDVEKTREFCAKVLGLLGETGTFNYHRR